MEGIFFVYFCSMISQRSLFLNYLAQTSSEPLLIEPKEASGIYITDVNDKKFIDLISGIGVSSVGHRHPMVLEAIQDQLNKYLHVMVYGEFVQSPQALFAKNLCDLLPEHLNNVYLVSSGSEAIEGAMKLAKKYTGRKKLYSLRNCYHGNTQAVMSLLTDEERKKGYGPYVQDVKHLEYNDLNSIKVKTVELISVGGFLIFFSMKTLKISSL